MLRGDIGTLILSSEVKDYGLREGPLWDMTGKL